MLASLLLGGCSAVRIGYNQAPTLAWWWLDGYMDFDAEQAPKVKEALNQWFAWHRTTQLPDYANLLAAAQVQVLQPATPQQVCRWADDLRVRLATAFAQGVPMAADLLPGLKAEQLVHLERRYRKSNRDFEEDYLQQDRDERQKAAVRRTIDRAEMLYGHLDERQRQLIAAGVAASPFDPAACQIVTSDGYPVVPGLTIPNDASSLAINAAGEVYAYFSDRIEPELLGQLTLAGFANEKGLEAMGSNLFLETVASGAPQVSTPGTTGLGILRQGYLEESSVDPVREVTELIKAQRGYELNAKVITAADQMLAATTQVR